MGSSKRSLAAKKKWKGDCGAGGGCRFDEGVALTTLFGFKGTEFKVVVTEETERDKQIPFGQWDFRAPR